MPANILTPSASFVQFSNMDVEHCTFGTVRSTLPVYDENDVAFQFVLETDTDAEADELSLIGNTAVKLGLVAVSLYEPLLIEFAEQPDRFRIAPRQILYNWTAGFPGFASVIDVGDCFKIRVEVTLDGVENNFPSNRFERIGEDCFTSVLEYGSEDNGFGFNYCASGTEAEAAGSETQTCEPTRITFTNMAILSIPYTAGLLAAYGSTPTVQAWIYDETGELVNAGIQIKFDAFPPSAINFDFGGEANGIVIIK